MILHPETGIAGPAWKEAIETVSSNVWWMEKNLESVNNWLKEIRMQGENNDDALK